jgi:hypothetical protein
MGVVSRFKSWDLPDGLEVAVSSLALLVSMLLPAA